MSLEPASSPRLATLARLAPESSSHATAADTPSPLPSAALAREVARCADCRARVPAFDGFTLCVRHEAVWRFEQAVGGRAAPMAGDVGRLLQQVLAGEDRGAELLDAFRRQATALNLVWEAHVRGAARLPDEVAESVRSARERAPSFLGGRGATRSA